MEIVYIIGQVIFGSFFVIMSLNHFFKLGMMAQYAASKKVPLPTLAIFGSGLFLLAGGLSIITGWYLQYALWLLVAFLVIVTLWMHNFWADKDPMMKMNNTISFMKNFALLGAVLFTMAFIDSWPWVLQIGQ